MNKLEKLKKKIIYRSNYRGTKEMDILLSSFTLAHINDLSEKELIELDTFLNLDDEIIYDFFQKDTNNNNISRNKVSELFKKFKL
jgi:antitoxin CptB